MRLETRILPLLFALLISVAAAADGPFAGPLCGGVWKSIRAGHELIYLENDRLLDWEPETGHYRVWRYDRLRSGKADPLPGSPLVEGTWKSIRVGHRLIYVGGNRLIDWEPESGHFRIWAVDPEAKGEKDPLSAAPEIEGTWGSIKTGHELLYLSNDAVLDWEPASGHYRIWAYDREVTGKGDPFPGKPLTEGTWKSIRTGHHLLQFNGDRVLDWEDSGHYRVWVYDVTLRGHEDPLPGDPVAEGDWSNANPQQQFQYLDGDRILNWDSRSGAYSIWSFEQKLDAMEKAEESAEELAAARAKAAEHEAELEKARRERAAQAEEDARNEVEYDRIQQELAELKARKQQDDAAAARAREEAQKKYEIELAKRELAKARQEQALARERAIALARQGVVALSNPLTTGNQYVAFVFRWKLWDGSYTKWGQGKVLDKRGWWASCPGAVSVQVKFLSSGGGEKNYALEVNQMPSSIKSAFEDGRPYTFYWVNKNTLDLYRGKPRN